MDYPSTTFHFKLDYRSLFASKEKAKRLNAWLFLILFIDKIEQFFNRYALNIKSEFDFPFLRHDSVGFDKNHSQDWYYVAWI